jgi:hypothetical protein
MIFQKYDDAQANSIPLCGSFLRFLLPGSLRAGILIKDNALALAKSFYSIETAAQECINYFC